jgi:hypothetical protein
MEKPNMSTYKYEWNGPEPTVHWHKKRADPRKGQEFTSANFIYEHLYKLSYTTYVSERVCLNKNQTFKERKCL